MRPGLEDIDHRRRWYEGVRETWYSQPGLLHAHVLGIPGTRDRMTFSVWETEGHYRDFVASGALQEVIAESDDIYAPDGRPIAEEWVVLSEDWPVRGRNARDDVENRDV
ncbi:hypothetical protein [Leucobacter sp.]